MVFDILKQALIDQLGIEPDSIKPETLIAKDLQLDSTETVILALEIKKKYGIDFKFSKKDLSLLEICNDVSKQINVTTTI